MSQPPTLRVALCQLNPVVGDLRGNVDRIAAAYEVAENSGADVAVFPELAVCGYPPEDLLLKARFISDMRLAVEALAAEITGHCAAIVGWVEGELHPQADPHDFSDGPWNSAAVLHAGRIVGSYQKQALPNYGVFDERRYFDPGAADQQLFRIGGVVVGLTVCEDLWVADGPASRHVRGGAEVILNLNASPFHKGKQQAREASAMERVAETSVPIVYVNMVGGQDELVFDGGSFAVDSNAVLVSRSDRFTECIDVIDVEVEPGVERDAVPNRVIEVSDETREASRPGLGAPGRSTVCSPVEEVWHALVLGVRDYVGKNGFTDVALGLSGGVDSTLVAAVAVEALGPSHVHGVLMPSRYSSDHSVTDAETLAANLEIEHRTVPIEPAHRALLEMLEPSFEGRPQDLTEENLQSRIRGVVLMGLSNKLGWLILATGNKSESAVGYSTLYGDTAGALAVIKDVPKMLVYDLCRWFNAMRGAQVIPESILTKAPSAELRPDQRDDQSLPPYELLDSIIESYVDGDSTVGELVDAGFDQETVARIVGLIDRAEYKRRQSPPGIRISQKGFGRDRRMPITNRY